MTQEADNYAFASCAEQVAECVEQLVWQTNEDLKSFRQEQIGLRTHIGSIVDENRNLSQQLDKYMQMPHSTDIEDLRQRLHLSNDALVKAKAQIDAFKKDRYSLKQINECADRTIKNLETELQSYRALLVKGDHQQMYEKTVKILESKLTEQQEEIRTQADMIKALHQHKQRYGEQIQGLEAELRRRKQDSDHRDDNEAKIAALQKQLKEYDKSLKQTKVLLDKSSKREALAMRKVQEAIGISEAAVREKEEAEKRAETYKEETTQLATNIGTVMDEAATRVDNEVDQLRTKLSKRDKVILSLREKLNNQIAEHKAMVENMEARNNRLSQKYEDTLKQNEKLASLVEDYNKRVMELEQNALKDQQLNSKKNLDPQIEEFLEANKQLKAHYKKLLKDLTSRFETEFEIILGQKSDLQAENELLKSGAAGDGIRKFIK